MTQTAQVLDSGGSAYTVENAVLNAAGASFVVHDDVLDASGNAFTIFSLVTTVPTSTPSSRLCIVPVYDRSCTATDDRTCIVPDN